MEESRDSKPSVPAERAREKPEKRVPDRASESIVGRSLPPRPSAVSSGEIEIPPGSFVPDSLAATSAASTAPVQPSLPPPSTVVRNAMQRGQTGMPLQTMVLIGGAIFVVLVGLTLMLFR